MTLIRRNNDMMPELGNLFNNVFRNEYFNSDVAGDDINTLPAVNVKENEDNFVIEVVAPGFKKENFNVSIDNGVLTISATEEEKKEEKKKNYTKREFNYASFTRSFRLPENVIDESTIKGNYKDGILEVFLGKREEVKPKPARSIKVS